MLKTIMIYDTVFVSDVHLGTDRNNSKKFLSFLKSLRTKKLVLVGDILDFYCLEKYKTNWTREHTSCVHELIKLMNNGTQVVYVIGNHDATLRRYTDFHYLNFSMVNEYTHIDSTGRKFLCVHGDQYSRYSSGSWRQIIFNKGYEFISPLHQFFKKTVGFSLINYCKSKNDNHSGVICGHIHYSQIKMVDDLYYMCCGDFCDTCTCITERNGIFQLQHY